jgi:uncharacterized SAM-binding protein YcdF (DUF218 family)
MEPSNRSWGLLRRRQCLVPTWRGCLALLLGLGLLAWVLLRSVYPFLALTDSKPGGVLVVEGWAPDNAMEAAAAEFNTHHYDWLFVTGGPLEQGHYLIEYKTAAQLGAATLVKLGVSTNVLRAVPTPSVRRDRTYAEAVSLKQWLAEHNIAPTRFNIMSPGPHARRSRLLFQKALGKEATVGVISVPVRTFDPERWWRSSPGFRVVSGELLAYLYVRVLFRPGST